MNYPTDIKYPISYVLPYESVNIKDADRNNAHYCFGCHQRMKVAQGGVRRWYFAHKPNSAVCDSSNALHEAAKTVIVEGFMEASSFGADYELGFPCQDCGVAIRLNIAEMGAAIASEQIAVEGTRSDLVVTTSDGKTPRVIIEIVVTHDLEPQTREKYQDAGIRVIKVKPVWDALEQLRQAAIGYDTLNIIRTRCPDCQSKKEHDEAREKAEQERVARFEGVASELAQCFYPRPNKRCELKPITHDKFGSPLRRGTRQTVETNARKLDWIGFEQQESRPTLFIARVVGWKIYADLGGSEIMRIWEVDCDPAIYAFPDNRHTLDWVFRGCLLRAVAGKLDAHGIPWRQHFEDSW